MSKSERDSPKHEGNSDEKRKQSIDEKDVGQEGNSEEACPRVSPHADEQGSKGEDSTSEVGGHEDYICVGNTDEVGEEATGHVVEEVVGVTELELKVFGEAERRV